MRTQTRVSVRPAGRATLAACAVVACLRPCSSRALADEGWTSPRRAGAWSAEFEIDPEFDFGLGLSAGASLSLKRYASDRAAIRAGVSVSFREQSSDHVLESIRGGGSVGDSVFTIRTGEPHLESHGYSLFVHLMRHSRSAERVTLFLEAGPSFRYAASNRDDVYLSEYGSNAYGSSSVDRTVALDALLGFEWSFTERVSLGARVGGWAGYSWGTANLYSEYGAAGDADHRLERVREESREVQFQSSRTTVMLTAYF